MIYLVVETSANSGIETWNNYFIETLKNHKYECELINAKDWSDDNNEIKESIIVFNNVRNKNIVNTQILSKLNDNNRLYFVIHGDICPVNKTFAYFSKLFHGIISVSKKVKSIILKHYPDKHVIYFPNKVDYSVKCSKRVLDTECVNFGYVGRIAKEKNIPLILWSFNKYLKINNNSRLHIFGDSPNKMYNEYINEVITTLNINDKVIQHGYVKDMDEIYKNIDILLLPSVSEGIPYCIIEASYYGIPVIATDVGCIKEIITHEENGLLFDLDGYPYIKSIFIHNYEYILYRIGYTAYIRGTNGKEVTDTKLHICQRKICNTKEDTAIISSMDCRINNSICNACMELLSKKMIFQKNIDRLTEQMMKAVDSYDKFTIKPIYNDSDVDTPVRELLENKMINMNKFDEFYPFNKTGFDFIINTNISYGKYYINLMRPLPYIITVKYELRGECYLFISDANKNLPFIISDLDDSGEKTIKIRISKPGHYKIGLRFRDDCLSGEIKVKNFTVRMYNVDMPTGNGFDITRYDLNVADRYRYDKNQEMDNLMFMFITCDRFEYKDRKNKLMEFLKTFKHKYIIVKGGGEDTLFDEESKILTLNTEEIYENLPKKVLNGFKWIYDNYPNITHVYKVDDDFGTNVMDYIPCNYMNYDYYGNFIVEVLISTWHYGKCKNKDLNEKEYNKPFINPHAGGGCGYILNRKSIKIIKDNEDEITDDIYEDKAIGDVLYKNGVKLNVSSFSGKVRISNNKTYTVDLEDSDTIVKIHSYKKSCLIYIIDNDELVYQKFLHELPLFIFRPNSLSAKLAHGLMHLTQYNFGNVSIGTIEDLNMDNITINSESSIDVIQQHNLQTSEDSNIIISDRVQFNKIYLFKWMELGLDIDTKNAKNLKQCKMGNMLDVKYNEMNDYDAIMF